MYKNAYIQKPQKNVPVTIGISLWKTEKERRWASLYVDIRSDCNQGHRTDPVDPYRTGTEVTDLCPISNGYQPGIKYSDLVLNRPGSNSVLTWCRSHRTSTKVIEPVLNWY
ncbi:UNVERIFIED_CONTAM: hypothetical protein FKN15_037359 [Acipenser sinensis]